MEDGQSGKIEGQVGDAAVGGIEMRSVGARTGCVLGLPWDPDEAAWLRPGVQGWRWWYTWTAAVWGVLGSEMEDG